MYGLVTGMQGRKLTRRAAAVILLLVVLCLFHNMRYSLPSIGGPSLTPDIGAQLLANYLQYENSDSRGVSAEVCSAYFAALEKTEPLWRNDYRENQTPVGASPEDYETKNLRGILERLRVYESCVAQKALPSRVVELDARMFPFITRNATPIFVSSDLQTSYGNGNVPIMGKPGSFKFEYDPLRSWIHNWDILCHRSSATSSRGIVMSFPDSHVSMAVRLLKVLAYQKNTLPIQVVHKGDLSPESQQLISDSLAHNQHLWFVDVSPMLDQRFTSDFYSYRNKWLATIFNTFQEIIFIDADAVSPLPVSSYFDLEEYAQSGALFFKDRAYSHKFDFGYCVPELTSLQPTPFETHYFGRSKPIDSELKSLTSSTVEGDIIKNLFVEQQRHHMDSGLLVVDKTKHLIPLIAGVFLNLAPMLSRCTHGDKESFWLAFLLTNHDYRFHPTVASAIGQLNEENEVCSVQLGHTDNDGSLLWFNGGYKVCKFADGIDYDWEAFKKHELHSRFSSIDEARDHYGSMMSFNAAVLPDVGVYPWRGGYGDLCLGYTYCARSTNQPGSIVSFDADTIAYLERLGKVWMDATDGEVLFFSP
ncbi:LADA_0E08724g1_1 [Lachancea dasiensis]|uniref:LADA_0E08724g1_1 n=1 Tax=Lachancea dasiensis TaxID=1072105 RepID=A0A1G4JDD9_9SACH|nr:LADA_0E08724g1_1 [Lachancea dasiensis]